MFGQLGGPFQKFFLGSLSDSYFRHRLSQLALYYIYLGIAQFIATYIAVVGFMYTREHITQKLREQYLDAVLRQNIALYDTLGAGEITSTITANMDLVLVGVSEKVAIIISALATFVTAPIVGFTRNWRLSFVLLSIVFAVLFVWRLWVLHRALQQGYPRCLRSGLRSRRRSFHLYSHGYRLQWPAQIGYEVRSQPRQHNALGFQNEDGGSGVRR